MLYWYVADFENIENNRFHQLKERYRIVFIFSRVKYKYDNGGLRWI